MLCPMLIKGHQANWIAEHPKNFECVKDCAWLVMNEAHGKKWGVCAMTFAACNIKDGLSSMVNFKNLSVTPGEQSPGNDKTTS